MSVQMTIPVENELAAFVDETVRAGQGSRADVINRALCHEVRRRAAQRDAQIYAMTVDPELDSDAFGTWLAAHARTAAADLDA